MRHKNRHILNALNRVHSEYCNIANEALKKMSVLTHQIMNFEEMQEIYQEEVLRDLFDDMKKFHWNEWLEELKGIINRDEE